MSNPRPKASAEPATSTTNQQQYRQRMKRPYEEAIDLAVPHGKLCRRTLLVPVEVPLTDFRCFCCFQLSGYILSCGCFLCRKCYQTRCPTKKVLSAAVSGCSCPSCGNPSVKSIDLDQLDDRNLKPVREVIDKMLDWPAVIYSLSLKYSGQKVNQFQYQDRLVKVALRKIAAAHKALQARGPQPSTATGGSRLCPTITSQQRHRSDASPPQQQNLLHRMKHARPSPSASHLMRSLTSSNDGHPYRTGSNRQQQVTSNRRPPT